MPAYAEHSKRKLLVLDVNGLLVDRYFETEHHSIKRKPDGKVGKFYVYKRPLCDQFLDFCFQCFDVGIWSSAQSHNVDKLVDFALGQRKQKLRFQWHQNDCTDTMIKSPENAQKNIFLKELSKLWNHEKSDLPWAMGEYDTSNTLLIDDSPYKAICNPANTAVFPLAYNALDEADTILGELQSYLEGLLYAANVQIYVQNNHFGQKAIDESSPHWDIYRAIIEKSSQKQKRTINASFSEGGNLQHQHEFIISCDSAFKAKNSHRAKSTSVEHFICERTEPVATPLNNMFNSCSMGNYPGSTNDSNTCSFAMKPPRRTFDVDNIQRRQLISEYGQHPHQGHIDYYRGYRCVEDPRFPVQKNNHFGRSPRDPHGRCAEDPWLPTVQNSHFGGSSRDSHRRDMNVSRHPIINAIDTNGRNTGGFYPDQNHVNYSVQMYDHSKNSVVPNNSHFPDDLSLYDNVHTSERTVKSRVATRSNTRRFSSNSKHQRREARRWRYSPYSRNPRWEADTRRPSPYSRNPRREADTRRHSSYSRNPRREADTRRHSAYSKQQRSEYNRNYGNNYTR